MLRKLCSKRSGFTLVEIIVAVAIFAIMSTMVAQVLQLSVKARQSNKEYGEDLARQEEQLLKVSKDSADYQDTNKTGEYNLNFKTTAADGTVNDVDVTLAYAIKDSSKNNTAEGINYFVSPVPYDGKFSSNPGNPGNPINPGNPGNPGGPGGGGGGSTDLSESMASIVDVRLTASRGMGYVDIKSVEKKGTPSTGAAVRYIFTTSASSAGMNEQDKAFAEYKLYFYLKGVLDPIKSARIYKGVDSSGNEFDYTKDIPLAANIISAGYCDATGTPCGRSGSSPTVRSSGANSITVSVALGLEGGNLTGDNYGGKGFVNETTTFYVDFEEDPQITAASFGSNGSPNGGGYRYNKYVTSVVGGTYENNYVYGAYGTTTNPDDEGGFVWRDLDGNIITNL